RWPGRRSGPAGCRRLAGSCGHFRDGYHRRLDRSLVRMEPAMRAQHWLSLATAVTVLCGAATLSSLVAPQVWLSPLVAGLVVTWLIMALLRRRRVGRIWPTGAALAGVDALGAGGVAAARSGERVGGRGVG